MASDSLMKIMAKITKNRKEKIRGYAKNNTILDEACHNVYFSGSCQQFVGIFSYLKNYGN